MARFALIDDDLISLQWLHAHLRRMGHDTVATGSAGVDLRAIERMWPDVVITSLLLNNRSGFELCRIIRRHPTLHRVSILVTSPAQDEEEREHALRQGADDFAVKPLRLADLGPKLERLYHLNQTAHEMDARTGLPGGERFKKTLGHRLARLEIVDLCCFELHGLAKLTQVYGQELHDALLMHAANALRESVEEFELSTDCLGFLGGGFLGAIVPYAHTAEFCTRVQQRAVQLGMGHEVNIPLLVRSVRPVPTQNPNVPDTFAVLNALIDRVPLAQHGDVFIDRRAKDPMHTERMAG